MCEEVLRHRERLDLTDAIGLEYRRGGHAIPRKALEALEHVGRDGCAVAIDVHGAPERKLLLLRKALDEAPLPSSFRMLEQMRRRDDALLVGDILVEGGLDVVDEVVVDVIHAQVGKLRLERRLDLVLGDEVEGGELRGDGERVARMALDNFEREPHHPESQLSHVRSPLSADGLVGVILR